MNNLEFLSTVKKLIIFNDVIIILLFHNPLIYIKKIGTFFSKLMMSIDATMNKKNSFDQIIVTKLSF